MAYELLVQDLEEEKLKYELLVEDLEEEKLKSRQLEKKISLKLTVKSGNVVDSVPGMVPLGSIPSPGTTHRSIDTLTSLDSGSGGPNVHVPDPHWYLIHLSLDSGSGGPNVHVPDPHWYLIHLSLDSGSGGSGFEEILRLKEEVEELRKSSRIAEEDFLKEKTAIVSEKEGFRIALESMRQNVGATTSGEDEHAELLKKDSMRRLEQIKMRNEMEELTEEI